MKHSFVPFVALSLAACTAGGLKTPADLGACAAGMNQCVQQRCADLVDPAACDARPDCYALFSGDLACASTACQNHFVKCESAPPFCTAMACGNVACQPPSRSCRPGDVSVYPDSSSCCNVGCVAATKCGGTSCTSDDQCGAHAYCRGLLAVCRTDCQLTIGTSSTGVCHRSCVGRDAHCTCTEDADCPGEFTSCDRASGTCQTIAPPICSATCPAGCTQATDAQFGPICVCSACPPSP
jgi:hypothetical protein